MRTFSIKELERFSGVKAHTIRIWEQRYGIFTPQRTEGNTRMYDLEDVRLLLDVAHLVGSGLRISLIAQMDEEERTLKLRALVTEADQLRTAIHHLIVYKFSGDIERFEEVLDSCVLYWDIETTIEKVILPFLERTELLSYEDRSCENHFAVTAIRKKIIRGIEMTRALQFSPHSALLFLPEGEHYDLMLLIMAYTLKRQGLQVLYLGTNIPLKSLEETIAYKKPTLLYTHVPQRKKFRLHVLLPFLARHRPKTHLFVVTGDLLQEPKQMADVTMTTHREMIAVLDHYLRRLQAERSS